MALSKESQEFQKYLLDVECAALVAPAIGLGANLGLFDVIISLGRPGTSDEIAKVGGFKERYVREWLGLMTVGKIIEFNAADKTYFIPQHRIPLLSKKSDVGVSLRIAGVHPCVQAAKQVEECFKLDGPTGVPYSSYPHFQEWRESLMEANRHKWKLIEDLLDQHAPQLRQKLEAGISVCEPGCSGGSLTRKWAQRFPNSDFLGFDIDKNVLEIASQKAKDDHVANVFFVHEDGCNLPLSWEAKFDLILCFLVVHDIPNSQRFLQEMKRCLKPEGIFLMVEARCYAELENNIALPTASDTYGYSLFHCLPISLYHQQSDGIGLCWGIENVQKALEKAGFKNVKIHECTEKFHARAYFICKNSR